MPKIRGRRQRHQVHHTPTFQQKKAKEASKLKKRQIEHKTSFFDSTMGKIVAIALIVLVIITPIIGFGYYMMSNHSSQTAIAPVHYTAIPPQYEEPVVPHEYFARGFVHPEQWIKKSDEKTTHACKISTELKELRTCNLYADLIREQLKTMPSVKREIDSPLVFHQRGYGFLVGDNPISLGFNSQVRRNHEAALEIIEKEVLTEDFPKKDIIGIIKKVHKELVKELRLPLEGYPLIKGGTYRTKEVVVQPEGLTLKPEELLQLIVSRHGHSAIPTFYSALEKVQRLGTKALSTEERKIWDSIHYTPPNPEEIPMKMKVFANEYSQKLLAQEHPFAVAAFVHMELVNIHSFDDANGRLARDFMNAELKRGGYLPIVILDDAAYTQAIIEDQKNPGAFADYLASIYPTSQKLNEHFIFPD